MCSSACLPRLLLYLFSWYKLDVQNPQHVFNISGMDPSACPPCLSACCFHNIYQSVLRVFVCLPFMPASTCVGLEQTECPQSLASLLAYASSLLSPGQCVHPVRREFRKETEKQTNKKMKKKSEKRKKKRLAILRVIILRATDLISISHTVSSTHLSLALTISYMSAICTAVKWHGVSHKERRTRRPSLFLSF